MASQSHMRPSRGFTMTELMVAVVIVALLASVAVPVHRKYIRYSRISEATTRIGEIITAAKAYALEHPSVAGTPTWPPAAGGGIVNLTSTDQFTYTITAGGGGNALTTTLSVRATGRAGKKMVGVTVTITLANINASGARPVVAGL